MTNGSEYSQSTQPVHMRSEKIVEINHEDRSYSRPIYLDEIDKNQRGDKCKALLKTSLTDYNYKNKVSKLLLIQ
ncbi:hypothetical protein OnM2_026087 [Erysiphe neolycopersici]|uniref:Uncharacterized protein n=1 Tax=Erysiphe neolycopersici TaxID=212602 RepID=A0A420I0X2_9PEZI|nr:hypothetical protein OnM2_026087 [Erysiphe neolycopersici]